MHNIVFYVDANYIPVNMAASKEMMPNNRLEDYQPEECIKIERKLVFILQINRNKLG